jgi:hypothetical protein
VTADTITGGNASGVFDGQSKSTPTTGNTLGGLEPGINQSGSTGP